LQESSERKTKSQSLITPGADELTGGNDLKIDPIMSEDESKPSFQPRLHHRQSLGADAIILLEEFRQSRHGCPVPSCGHTFLTKEEAESHTAFFHSRGEFEVAERREKSHSCYLPLCLDVFARSEEMEAHVLEVHWNKKCGIGKLTRCMINRWYL
jgi:hypothetical protein